MKDTLKLSANVRMGRGIEDKLLAYFEENVRHSDTKEDRFFWTDRISELLKREETQELSNEVVLWLMHKIDYDSEIVDPEIANPEMEEQTRKILGCSEDLEDSQNKSAPKLEDFVISKWTAQDVKDEARSDFNFNLSDEQILEISNRLRNGTSEVTHTIVRDEIDNYISEIEEDESHES